MKEDEEKEIPTMYEWAGGKEAMVNLLETFYEKVKKDDLLAPLFINMADDHAYHVALWFGEVFGGPPAYTEERGGFKTMIRRHRGQGITAEQRNRWIKLMQEAADDVELPSDPEFRAAFSGYIEWGSRRAFRNSQPGAPMSKRTTVPRWGWGSAPPGTP